MDKISVALTNHQRCIIRSALIDAMVDKKIKWQDFDDIIVAMGEAIIASRAEPKAKSWESVKEEVTKDLTALIEKLNNKEI